ncbi:MAG: 3'(2'),5'-bisphosphate nucleotidase CysQ [Candidatus Sumerlaeia bacterium]
MDDQRQDQLANAISAAIDAGRAIMEVYEGTIEVENKADGSPLTEADLRSHRIICDALDKGSDYPVLSEESKGVAYADRKDWPLFWLVDPLDGTKEFIKRNGEFTVNIALIEGHRPVMGVVYAPVLDILYAGLVDQGAWYLNDASKAGENISAKMQPVPVAKAPAKELIRVVASRSHMNDDTREFISGLESRHDRVELVSKGSSLKICMLAMDEADIYPRVAPTMEWDTAAAHGFLLASGGQIYQFGSDEALVYNKADLLNPFFVGLQKRP